MPSALKKPVLIIATFAVALAGCGGSDSSTETSGLGDAVPADASIYFEGVVRPNATQASDIEEIAAHFPGGQDLGATILQKFNEGLTEDKKPGTQLTFEQDFDPWLGEHAAVFFKNASDDDPTFVVEVTDEDAAKETVKKLAEADVTPGTTSEEKGVEISIDSEGQGVAVTNDVLIAGPEAGVKESIDIAEGDGDDLSGADDFTDSIGRVDGDEALGYLYLNTDRTIETAQADPTDSTDSSSSPDQIRSALDAVGFDSTKNFSASVSASGGKATAEFSIPSSGAGEDAGNAFEELPGDAVIATAIGNFGEGVGKGFDAALKANNDSEGTSAEETKQQIDIINSLIGFDIADLGEVVGPGAVYASGTTPADLKVGAVVSITDPERASKAISTVKGLITASGAGTTTTDLSIPGAETAFSITSPQLPVPVEIAYDGKRLVVAGGSGAAAATISPTEMLGDAATLEGVSGDLAGDEPSAFVDVPKFLELLQGTGATNDPSYAEAAPYLAAFGQFAAGSGGTEDGYNNSHAVLSFTDSAPAAPSAADQPSTPTK